MDILGVEYELLTDDYDLEETGADGLCEVYSKEIKIRSIENMLDDVESIEAKETRYVETLRHEIIHAFLYESGFVAYYNDELLIDYLAIQFPKLLEIFKEQGCI